MITSISYSIDNTTHLLNTSLLSLKYSNLQMCLRDYLGVTNSRPVGASHYLFQHAVNLEYAWEDRKSQARILSCHIEKLPQIGDSAEWGVRFKFWGTAPSPFKDNTLLALRQLQFFVIKDCVGGSNV